MPYAKRVFLSYAHESEEHKNLVLQLCEQFRTSGLDAWMDQYEQFPPQGWPQWMLHQIKQADFVLVVCTEIYRKRFEGEASAGAGKGAKWEGAVISLSLYELEGLNRKFIPVVVSSADKDFIPIALKSFTHFDVSTTAGRDALYRLLTDQPAVVPSPIGGLVDMPVNSPSSGIPQAGSRVRAKIKFTSVSKGWVPLLDVANVSDVPLFLENPQLILKRNANSGGKDEGQLADLLETQLLPTRPISGPLLPTQQRSYFLHPDVLKLIRDDTAFFGVSTPFIRIATAVSEELLLDDAASTGSLKSILGFPGSGDSEYDKIRMPIIMGLVHKRCTDQANEPFKVYAPKEIVENPDVIQHDDIVDRLKDKKFRLLFSDGESEVVSLAELMMFSFQLIFLSLEMKEVEERLKRSGVEGGVEINVKANVNTELLMNPEVVKSSLSKFDFEPTPYVPD